MAFTQEKWLKRIKHRSDISAYVYHLTKAEVDADGKVILDTLERFRKIINERKINGSTTESGFITGNRKAVCFQDAPISGIVQNVLHEKSNRDELGGKTRYTYFGLGFQKPYIFLNGGRPVLYEEKEIAKKILPKNEWWRIVDYNLSDEKKIVDWTHEREWRMPIDEFHFDLSKAILLVPNKSQYGQLIEKLPEKDLKTVSGIIQINPILN